MKEILDRAYAEKYGVPAIPGNNEIQVRAAIEAAVEANSPVIFLGYNQGNPAFIFRMIHDFADQIDVPVAICLDHSPSYEDCVTGIRNGVSAIMADRSMLPYEENAAQVKELAKVAHACGVSIEAELGHVGQGNNYAVDGVSMLTDPEEAKRFIDETGCDGLAVAIGTAHGTYSGTPHLDFGRLQEIDDACRHPLVLHGGSGSGDENIHKACTMGVAKVNIVTDVLAATYQGILDGDFHGNAGHQLFPAIAKANKQSILRCFEITGSTGKAWSKKAEAAVANDYADKTEK